jgi:DNA (cytosine-5)-methyltransferase 1
MRQSSASPITPPMQKLRGVDLYCGAGGMTTGAHQSGRVRVELAVNHWRPAILTHSENHPQTRHICAEVQDVDPANDATLPDCDLVMAGVECTHHSNAKGGAPVSDQKRSSARNVLDWVRAKRPKYLVIENVREFCDWGRTRLKRDKNGKKIWDKKHRQWAREADPRYKGEYFRAWWDAVKALGYTLEKKLINSADHGEAQKRIRLFIIARLDPRPFCWPLPTHSADGQELPRWRAAAEIINWGRPAASVFGRKKPLAPKTLARIKIGLVKFNAPQTISAALEGAGFEPFIVKFRGTGLVDAIGQPLATITAGGTHLAIATPYCVNLKGRSTVADLQLPLLTVTAHAQHLYLAEPFLTKYHAGHARHWQGSTACSIRKPLPTVDTNPRYALAHPFMVQTQGPGVGDLRYAGVQSATDPLRTVLTRINHGVATPFLCHVAGPGSQRLASTLASVAAPLRTLLTREDRAVVQPFIVPHFGERTGQAPRSHATSAPLSVVTSRGAGNLVQPYLFALDQQSGSGSLQRIAAPLSTITVKQRHCLATPYLMPRQGFFDCRKLKRCQSIDEPLNSITATHVPAHLVMPYLVDVNHGESNRSPGGRVHSVSGPLGSVTTKRSTAVITPAPFIVNYYGTGIAHEASEPLSTVTTKHRHGLTLFGETRPTKRIIVLNADEASLFWTMRLLGIDDILFRMLEVDELALAMGLPADYIIHGNKAEQIKQVGNMVCVKVMKAICEAIGAHAFECEEAIAA